MKTFKEFLSEGDMTSQIRGLEVTANDCSDKAWGANDQKLHDQAIQAWKSVADFAQKNAMPANYDAALSKVTDHEGAATA